MTFTLAEAHAGSERRLDVDSTRAAIDFTEWKERFTHGDPVLGTGFDAFWIQPAVERAYLEVTHALDDRQQQLVAQLGAIERSAWEAWKARDSTFFTRALETDARYVSGAGYATPSRLAHQTATFQCAVGTIELDHLEARALGEDGALLMGRALYDYTCAGNTTRAVSWFSTGFRRPAGDWRIVFHQETDAPKDGGG